MSVPSLKPEEAASWLRTMADYMEQNATFFPQDKDYGTVVKVFFGNALNQMTLKEKLILAAKLIEGADNDTLVVVNRLTMKEAEKRGMTKTG